jgi:hypothetical protein
LIEVACSSGPHHAALRCPACDKHIAFLPKPWTRHRAENFQLRFGMHRGKSLAELARTASGREYLAWMADHVQGNPGTAARIMLAPVEEAS